MPETSAYKAEARLTLTSRLSELTLVWPWVDALALEYSIPADTHYAINLCLEEALSNVIRHGYAGEPDHTLTVECKRDGESAIAFVIEDSAPPFSPIETANSAPAAASSPTAAPASILDVSIGGHGIHFMRRFASSVAWEQLPNGNRLILGFRIPHHPLP